MNARLPTSLTSTEPLPTEWVTRLFDRMLVCFGKRFTDQWASPDPEKLVAYWAEKLGGYSGAELKRGVDAMEKLDYPPTLPQFLKLCRPPIDPLAAYYEAVEGVTARERGEAGNWSHPAIFWASVAVGAHDLKSSTYSAIKQRWENALQAEIDKGVWVDIPEPVLSLPAPSKRESDRQTAERMLAALKVSTADSRTDHRAWIRKNLERMAAGEKLPVAVMKLTKEAAAEAHE